MRTMMVCLLLAVAAAPLLAQEAGEGAKAPDGWSQLQRLRIKYARSLAKEAEALLKDGKPEAAALKFREALNHTLGVGGRLPEKIRTERIAALRKQFAELIQQAAALRKKGSLFEAFALTVRALRIDPSDETVHESARDLRVRISKVYRRYLAMVRPEGRPHVRLDASLGADSPLASAAERALSGRLREVLPRLDLQDVTLEEAVQVFGKATKANVHVRWRTLRRAGVLSDSPVNVQLKDVTVATGLRAVLDDAARTAGADASIDFAVRGGILIISTYGDFRPREGTVIYDVREVLRSISPPPLAEIPHPRSFGRIARVEFEEDDESLFEDGEPDWEPTGSEAEIEHRAADALISVLQRCIDPESWIEGSTKGGSLKYYRGALIVEQTEPNQLAVYRLLKALHEVHARQRQVNALVATGTRPARLLTPELRYESVAAMPISQTGSAGEADRKVAGRLAAVLGRIALTNQRLDAAIRSLGEAMSVPIRVRWRALEEVGVLKNARASLQLENVTGGTALSLLLADFSVGGEDDHLAACIRDGTVVVSTVADLNRETYIVLYDIRDLFPPAIVPPDVRRQPIPRELGLAGDDDGGLFADDDDDDDDDGFAESDASAEEIQRIAGDIIDMLHKTIEPESWIEGSPTSGSMSFFHGTMIVNQTARNHARLRQTLEGLRRILVVIEGRPARRAKPAPASRPAK